MGAETSGAALAKQDDAPHARFGTLAGRPLGQAAILKGYLPDTVGFISYSEGCNDDVNKFVWSGLGWDPEADVVDILRQYSRCFLSDSYADPFAQALLALERNWSGPLLTNAGVETTLRQLQTLEREASPAIAGKTTSSPEPSSPARTARARAAQTRRSAPRSAIALR